MKGDAGLDDGTVVVPEVVEAAMVVVDSKPLILLTEYAGA